MAKLAIKGHSTRGNEVIEILEMLGGNNIHNYVTDCTCFGFYICDKTRNIYYDWIHNFEVEGVSIYTLEEFLEKYPYKVGDKVSSKYLKNYEVSKMEWKSVNNRVIYKLQGMGWYSADELQPYKEETMDKAHKVVFDANAQCCDISNKIIKKETMKKEISGAIIDRFICLEGYDFYDDKGNIIDTKEITMKKKQPKYPKTYEECCNVLGINELPYMVYTWNRNEEVILQEYQISTIEKLDRFRKLLICRDAYWKIAVKWKPDYTNPDIDLYVIINVHNNIEKAKYGYGFQTCVLSFPTEEMRDAFYENFKGLIEECKELL